MVLALAHSRGWLDYDERVCTYWPEFAQAGKERITVRQLLAHQAGLFAFDEKVDREVVADLDRLSEIMARQRPAWEPGERQAYHAISLGFYEGELVRRIDPRHRSLGRFFARGDRRAARPRLLHRDAGVDPRRAPRAARAAQPLEAADLAATPAHAGGDEPTFRPLPIVDRQPRDGVLRRSASTGRAEPGGSLRRRRRHCARDREGVRRVRERRSRTRASPRDDRGAGGPGGPVAPRVLRRVLPRAGEVLAGVHEAERGVPLRPRERLRSAGGRRLDGLRRPAGRHRLRLRDEPDGHAPRGRPARRRAPRRDPDAPPARLDVSGGYQDRRWPSSGSVGGRTPSAPRWKFIAPTRASMSSASSASTTRLRPGARARARYRGSHGVLIGVQRLHLF